MATIHKLTKDGSTIFPATITDAIVHPSVSKTLTSMIKDYNVSELFPTEGVGGGNTYTLSLAIQVLGTHLRTEEKTGGLKLKFISSTSSNCEEEYYLTKSTWSTSISDWEQKFGVGDVIGDPVGSWTPGTAEAYVDQKIAEQNQWLLGQETKINLNKNLISQEMQARQNRDAELTDLINEGIREGSGVQFDNTPTSGSVNAVTSNGIFQALYDDSSAYNVTLHHPTSGVSGGATYTLALAYAAVPSTVQRGGLTIKFIDSTSLIYSHYRLNTASWPSTFNKSDWTSMNVDDTPTPLSNNLVKSGGVFREVAEQIMTQFGGRFGVKNLADITTSTSVTSAYFDNIVDGRTTIIEKSSSAYRVIYGNEILKKGTVIHFTGTTTSARAQYYGATQIEPSGNIVGMELDHCYVKTVNGQHDDWFIMPYDGYFFYAFYNQNWSNRLFEVVIPELIVIPDITPLIPNNSFDFFSENPVQNGFLAKQLLGNPINYVAGRFITSTGSLSGPGTAYSYALDVNNNNNSYFQCNPQDVIIWHAGGNYSGIFLCFYDSEKVFISYFANNSRPRRITAPSNAAYFRFSYVTANIADAYCKVNDKLVWKALAASESILPKVIDNVNTTETHSALSAFQGYMLDRHRSLYVIGNNTTLVGKAFKGVVVGGHSYKIHLLNKDFDVSGDTLTTVHDRLNIRYKKRDSAEETIIVRVNNTTPLSDYYNFTVGQSGDIIEYISIYLRATKDVIVQFLVEDVTYAVDDAAIKANSFNLNGVDATQTDEKILEFTNLFQNAGSEIQSFVFFTDPHLFNNVSKFNDYILSIQKYYRNTPTDFVLCGGDWLQSGDSVSRAVNRLAKVDAVCRRMFEPYYPILGNHDTNYLGGEELSATVIKNLWFRKYGKAYYDFVNINTRYYVFDTGKDNDHSMSAYRTGQLTWLADSLLQNTGDEHIILCFHIYYYNTTSIEGFAQNIINVAAAYNNRGTITVDGVTKDFASATGKVHAAIVGHSHRDFNVYNSGIPVIATINTQSNNTPSYDLVLVDYTNDVINLVRVGSGSSRTISLTEPNP